MELVKKGIRYHKIGRQVSDQFYVDDDINVPDSKADVARVVLSEGRIRTEEVKVSENYARVTGKLQYQILYVTDEAEPRLASLQGKIPFEEMVYLEEEPAGQVIIKSCSAELTVSFIHSRKLNVKAVTDMELSVEGEREEILCMDADGNGELYKKFDHKEVLALRSVRKDTYRIREEMKIAGTKENIGILLWTEVSLRKLDTRLGRDELKLRGELLVFCVYESQEGKTDWVEQTVPYEGRIECFGADDTMYHHFYAELADENVDVRMDEDGEMRIFGIEATLEIRVSVYEEEHLQLLKDLYSLREKCVPSAEEITLESLVMQNHSKYKLSEQLSLPELKDDILQICHSTGFIQLDHTEITAEGILVEGVLNVSFLYVKADDTAPFDVWQGMVPFTHIIETNETAPDMRCDITSGLEQISVGLLGNQETEVKAVLAFHIFLRRPEKIRNIQNVAEEPIDMEEAAKAPGIVGYIVREGEGLWDLAKRFSTTVEGICEVNNVTEENVKPGDKILIFKENMSIL